MTFNKNYVIIALGVLLVDAVFVIAGLELMDLHVAIGNRDSSIKLDTGLWIVLGASAAGPPFTLFSILYFAGAMNQMLAARWGANAFMISLVLFLVVGCVGQRSAQYRLARADYIACKNPDYQPGGKLKGASALIYEKSTCKERNQEPW